MTQTIAQTLKLYRADRGWTQLNVANKINISRRAYAKYEDGTNEPPVTMLLRIASAYECTLNDLCYGTTNTIDSTHAR